MNLGKPLLEELFNKQIRFRIPVFQRHYVWNEKEQLMPLWEDLINKYNERYNKQKIHPHYTGSIVLFHENTPTSTLSTYSVIDGQQRLTALNIGLYGSHAERIPRRWWNNPDAFPRRVLDKNRATRRSCSSSSISI